MLEHQPTLETLQALRQPGLPPMRVGEFSLASGKPASMDRKVVIRLSPVTAPGDGSFSHYLRDTLISELKAAGKYDPAANVVIEGRLTQSEVRSNPPNGKALVGADFTVTRGGKEVFSKSYTATSEWESSFMGAIAIPEAMDRYTDMYAKLVTLLVSDKAFQAAVSS